MIGVIGINYKSSPIEIREKFSFDESRTVRFAEFLKGKEGFSGLVVISTCNRSEFYFQMGDCCKSGAFSYVFKSLKEFCNVSENIRDYFYMKANDEAFKHLFYVVSGANSMILGEYQIVNQVKNALQLSLKFGISDTELTRLFTKSLEANKKIRTQTKISEGAFSVSYAGVEKCFSVFPDCKDKNVFIVGAGETGTLALRSLVKKGCDKVVITNRTHQKAITLANAFGMKTSPFEEIGKQLEESDIVIVSTGSQVALINKEMVEKANKKREGKKQLFIDLSVPRNITADVGDVENVIIYDVDDLQEVVQANHSKRKKFIEDADVIIDEYMEDFNNWLSTRNLGEVIAAIKTNFSTINQSELAGFKKVNKTGENEIIDSYGSHITNKYVRLLIRNLKEVTGNGRKTEYVKVLHELFDLN